ncbi:hypothetical protein HYT84_04290, partial [Candidatus Micrarchaeota archaeon]|nr:hypothetical protein [Candidatus Micrarchaeota archaeon]
NGGMAVIIQSVVGTNVGEGHFGPLFSGVLDTSPINGDGTITFSVVLGLGTSAVGGIHNANVLIAKKGSFSKRTIDVIARQKLGELLSHTRGISEELETDALLRIFSKFRSINDAMDFFIKHYMNSLYILSLALETVFDRKPIDLEFAISPKTGRLYLLQARHSNMRRVKNPDYPENIKEEDIIAISRTVLGAKTSSTKLVVSLSQEQYSREAREGFSSLLSIDAENKPYILVVPPEATSSKHEQLPLTMLKNVVHIVEKLVPDQIHTPGVSGVDHMSRLVAELDLGYMEAHVNFERIAKNSNVRPYGNVTLYEGNFGAAVCSATSKGVFYLEKI